ncbi:MAG: AbrB/MazE/SpoVT family DNA-binding domain-containing protein [Chthoniobacterales bacterium]|nr:MAG: AbrB/MazE/SpoVT family DNA-binding domain-containing protein [Chthoniobacterales bacterium]
MSNAVLRISRIGNSRGIRLPAAMLRKYHMKDALIAEERADEIVLRPQRATRRKLSWAETAKAMAVAREVWSDWDMTAGDGLHGF